MALYELDEFQGPQLIGFARSIVEPSNFIGSQFLPDDTVDDLAFEYIKGVSNRPVMASVMAYGAEAPLAGRMPLGERVQGELPPIKRKAAISEKEIIRFLQPRANSNDVQRAIDSVYDLTANLVQGVLARVEWLRIKALSEDTLAYDANGITFEIDYGVNDEYQIDMVNQVDGASSSISSLVSTVWSDTTNADPVADLQYLCNKMEEETGYRPANFVCSSKTVNLLLNNAKIKALVFNDYQPQRILTRGELDSIFVTYGLPAIQVLNTKVRSEADNGTTSDARLLAENKAFLTPDFAVGKTLWGPTAESRALIGTELRDQMAGIVAVGYANDDPPEELIKAAAVALPTMPDVQFLGQMTLYA